jgi:hypothetical protein
VFNRIQPALDRTQPAIQCEKQAARMLRISASALSSDHGETPPGGGSPYIFAAKVTSPQEKIIFIEPAVRNNLLLPGAGRKAEISIKYERYQWHHAESS